MKISAVIPVYNCAATIRATLDSVLQQTVPPDEILIIDDGSTDDTASILESYKPRITVFWQRNQGVAVARNELVARAKGDLLAFLDHDDLWHPEYLEVQRSVFEQHPAAVASFTGHLDIYGNVDHQWTTDPSNIDRNAEVIPPLNFFERYNRTTGLFASLSYCCIPRNVLHELGTEPFKVPGVDDSYCCSLLALLGPVVYTPAQLAAYRFRTESLSQNHLRTYGDWVHAFEILQERYTRTANPALLRAFGAAYAAKRRSYAKLLMGAGKITEAREQLRRSVGNSSDPASIIKSMGMVFVSYMPKSLQPTWPPSHREWKVPDKP
jgi:glycosyltransferase involved in cell wall biosynthesis